MGSWSGLFGRLAQGRPASGGSSAVAADDDVRFAPSVDACDRALALLAPRLPPDFLSPSFRSAWVSAVREGRSAVQTGRADLLALLPPPAAWPELTPVCTLMEPDETAPSIFLRTLDAKAHELVRESREVLPLRRLVAVQEARTSEEHRRLHGLVRPAADPFWAEWARRPHWGCRCVTTFLTQRTVDRRGWTVSP